VVFSESLNELGRNEGSMVACTADLKNQNINIIIIIYYFTFLGNTDMHRRAEAYGTTGGGSFEFHFCNVCQSGRKLGLENNESDRSSRCASCFLYTSPEPRKEATFAFMKHTTRGLRTTLVMPAERVRAASCAF